MPENLAEPLPERLGDFRILGLLGSGGSGQVFRASWGPRRVALKVLRPDLLAAESERRRFFAEARMLAELGHPGIVKILSFGELPDGRPYLAMELLEGEVLAARLARGPLPLAAAQSMLAQLADAMGALHERGLIHRDLKPENVLLVEDRYAVLLDFGIAKALDAPASTTTQEGGVRGTPAYMAPERFFGQPASVASDVYELAVLFYNLVVGALPWHSGLDPEARLNPTRPGERGVSLPPEVETALMRGLSTRPEARPATVRELADSLGAAGPRPASDTGPGPVDRTTAPMGGGAGAGAQRGPSALTYAEQIGPTATATRLPRRRPLYLVAAALVAACAVAAAVWLWPRPAKVAVVTGEVRDVRDSIRSFAWGADRATKVPPPRRSGDDSGFAAAVRYHPADTSVLLGVRARELRQSPAFAEIIDREKKRGALAMLVAATSACQLDAIDDLDWFTLGLAGDQRDEADLVVAGNFDRDKVEGCLAAAGKSLGSGFKARRRGAVTEVKGGPEPWYMLWIDEHTVMVTTRHAVDRDWFDARRRGEDPVTASPEMADALEALDREATIWLVGEPDSLRAGAELQGIPVPDLLWGDIRVSKELAMRGTLRYGDPAHAAAAKSKLDDRISELKSDPMAAIFFETLSTRADRRDVEIQLELGTIATQLVAQALAQAIRESSK